jgi:hypothetical protein
MAWHQITDQDVLEEFTPAEQAALKGIQGADSLPRVLARVIAQVRGAIRAGGYELGDDNTIPDQLDGDAVAIARWRWLISFPQLKALQTVERKQAHDDAQKRIDKVAQQEMKVESPNPGTTANSGSWNSENKITMRTHPTPRPSTQQGQQTDAYANPEGPADA